MWAWSFSLFGWFVVGSGDRHVQLHRGHPFIDDRNPIVERLHRRPDRVELGVLLVVLLPRCELPRVDHRGDEAHGVALEVAHQESLLSIRLLFLRGKVTEEQAKTRVLAEDEKQEKIFRQRNLLEMYLNTINDLQRCVYIDRSAQSIQEASKIYKNLIETCKEASLETQKELGGECLKFSCNFGSSIPHVTL